MATMNWVLIDKTNGAKTTNGLALSRASLEHMAEAVMMQVNTEYLAEWGSQVSIRVGADESDVRDGEWVYSFAPTLPDAPNDTAYHDYADGHPFAICAVTLCDSLYGPTGIAADVSHEILEAAGDEGANLFAYDNAGQLHGVEMCDAVEVQTYPKTCKDGTVVQVSNWLLRAWFNPGSSGPYDYMSSKGIVGAVAPPGPLQTAAGKGGNYQLIGSWSGNDRSVAGMKVRVEGTRRKNEPHWSSRAFRRMRGLRGLEIYSRESRASKKRVGPVKK